MYVFWQIPISFTSMLRPWMWYVLTRLTAQIFLFSKRFFRTLNTHVRFRILSVHDSYIPKSKLKSRVKLRQLHEARQHVFSFSQKVTLLVCLATDTRFPYTVGEPSNKHEILLYC